MFYEKGFKKGSFSKTTFHLHLPPAIFLSINLFAFHKTTLGQGYPIPRFSKNFLSLKTFSQNLFLRGSQPIVHFSLKRGDKEDKVLSTISLKVWFSWYQWGQHPSGWNIKTPSGRTTHINKERHAIYKTSSNARVRQIGISMHQEVACLGWLFVPGLLLHEPLLFLPFRNPHQDPLLLLR